MKTLKSVSGAVLMAMCVRMAVGEGCPDCIVGRWISERGGSELWFMSSGAGVERIASGMRYFVYRCSTNRITLDYGGGTQEEADMLCETNRLQWIVEHETNVYQRVEIPFSTCLVNLLCLEAAIQVYAADHPEAVRVTVGDLIPQYMAQALVCAEGGIYVVGDVADKPSCSVHGAAPTLQGGEP